MSQTLTCPDCDEKVTLKAGRSSAKCPACGSTVTADRPSARRKRDDDDREERKDKGKEKAKPKRKYREEWDDDDDDDKPKKPAKQGGGLGWLWLTLGILAFVCACCGGGVWGFYTFVSKARDEVVKKNDQMQQRMNDQWGGGFNPPGQQGRPNPPPPKDASLYDKKKPFDVDPQLLAKPSPVYLDDLTGFEVKQGQHPIGRNGALGYDNRWVQANGTFYDHGIGMIPPNNGAARMSFAVGGQARRVKGGVAICDFWHDGEASAPVTFAIYKDGKEVWRSPPVKRRKVPVVEFDIDITGARVITLETDAPTSAHDAHCVWLDPVLVK